MTPDAPQEEPASETSQKDLKATLEDGILVVNFPGADNPELAIPPLQYPVHAEALERFEQLEPEEQEHALQHLAGVAYVFALSVGLIVADPELGCVYEEMVMDGLRHARDLFVVKDLLGGFASVSFGRPPWARDEEGPEGEATAGPEGHPGIRILAVGGFDGLRPRA